MIIHTDITPYKSTHKVFVKGYYRISNHSLEILQRYIPLSVIFYCIGNYITNISFATLMATAYYYHLPTSITTAIQKKI